VVKQAVASSKFNFFSFVVLEFPHFPHTASLTAS